MAIPLVFRWSTVDAVKRARVFCVWIPATCVEFALVTGSWKFYSTLAVASKRCCFLITFSSCVIRKYLSHPWLHKENYILKKKNKDFCGRKLRRLLPHCRDFVSLRKASLSQLTCLTVHKFFWSLVSRCKGAPTTFMNTSPVCRIVSD